MPQSDKTTDIVAGAAEVARLVDLLARNQLAAKDAGRLSGLAKELRKVFNTIANQASVVADARATASRRAQARKKILDRVQLPAAAVPVPAGGEVEPAAAAAAPPAKEAEILHLQQFFESVSKSLVAAQGELNRQSIEYNRGLDPAIPPAFFAIPNLKAEMKVGFDHVDERGLNIILFSRKQQRESYGESTVSFEVSAAPPPPGEGTFGRLSLPIPRFLVVGEQKSRLLDRIAELAAEKDKKLGASYDKARDVSLVLRVAAEEGEPPRFLVFWPSQHPQTKTKELWLELSVFLVAGEGAEAKLDESLFQTGPFLTIPTARNLLGEEPEAVDERTRNIVQLARDFGDAFSLLRVAITEWVEEVTA